MPFLAKGQWEPDPGELEAAQSFGIYFMDGGADLVEKFEVPVAGRLSLGCLELGRRGLLDVRCLHACGCGLVERPYKDDEGQYVRALDWYRIATPTR